MNRDEWLTERRKGLGASDVANRISLLATLLLWVLNEDLSLKIQDAKTLYTTATGARWPGSS